MSETILNWHDYSYFPYEKEFALREAKLAIGSNKINSSTRGIILKAICDINSLKRLTYFSSIDTLEGRIPTQQALFETNNAQKVTTRQQTRYSSHGMHEYKGKFNPQVVRSLINILGISPGDKVLDPFCGSGTTLLECKHSGVSATGFDLNPLAIQIAKAKVDMLDVDHKKLLAEWGGLWNQFTSRRHEFQIKKETTRTEYLKKWMPEQYFLDYELLLELCNELPEKTSNIFKVVASNRIRDFSYQDPADLRIRKRKDKVPKQNIHDILTKDFTGLLEKVIHAKKILDNNSKPVEISAYCADSKLLVNKDKLKKNKPSFTAVITSPPYATALPYIDTQRLSLVWFNLCGPTDIHVLDSALVGSREFNSLTKGDWMNALNNNTDKLSHYLYEYCLELQKNLGPTDGFRRQAMPPLMYRYLVDMRDIFSSLLTQVVPGGKVAMIVGYNHTVLGGKKIEIKTPDLLVEAAKNAGWELVENTPLESYQRYGIHHKNSVAKEALIVVKNNG